MGYGVPGVYFEPRPRTPDETLARTDVVGFIGFEPRLRDGTTPSALVGTGHDFNLDVAGFDVVIRDRRLRVPDALDFDVSAATASSPIVAGQGIAYAIVAVATGSAAALRAVPGTTANAGEEVAPDDAAIVAALAPPPASPPAWVRVADVVFRERGGEVWPIVRPALTAARCDDWRDFVLAFGEPRDDGTFLATAVRAYFANGGSRCWVATVPRPRFIDRDGLAEAQDAFAGVAGASEREATGLERLFQVGEPSVIDAPDLYAGRDALEPRRLDLPARAEEACFRPCPTVRGASHGLVAAGDAPEWLPIFDETAVATVQRDLLRRCVPAPWRAFLLLSVPQHLDPLTGTYGPPSRDHATAWRDDLAAVPELQDETARSVAGLYWPWVRWQRQIDTPALTLPPTPFAAGVIARRDLARGPAIAPANETVRGAVALATPVDDAIHAALYVPPPDTHGNPVPSINLLRSFPGYGVQLWGARTLSSERWLQFVPIRRGLSAIERRVRAALDDLVFEPNTPALWLQVTQIVLGILMPLFDAGAMRGDRPEDSFFVRCDASVNPPEVIEAGQLVCEVGVALAAPAEFIVFRLGRREGVVEVVE